MDNEQKDELSPARLEAFDDAAGDVASLIYAKYCDLGLSAVEREVFLSEMHQRLADILQYRDGEKITNKAKGEYESLVASEEEYDKWSDESVVKNQPDYDPKTRSLKHPRAIGGSPTGLSPLEED